MVITKQDDLDHFSLVSIHFEKIHGGEACFCFLFGCLVFPRHFQNQNLISSYFYQAM